MGSMCCPSVKFSFYANLENIFLCHVALMPRGRLEHTQGGEGDGGGAGDVFSHPEEAWPCHKQEVAHEH